MESLKSSPSTWAKLQQLFPMEGERTFYANFERRN
jgi:hypothetical protein